MCVYVHDVYMSLFNACCSFKQLLFCYWIISPTLSYTFHVLLLFNGTQCRAFAKALHYKEMEFEGARSKKMDANPVAVVEAFIHINNQLHQHEVELNRNEFFKSRFTISLLL